MSKSPRVFNFCAGPAQLPEEVLSQAQEDLWSYGQSGIGILELSHRSSTFDRILHEAESGLRVLASIPDDYAVLFLAGGMTTQFALAPLNFLAASDTAEFLHTGVWTGKAIDSARRVAKVHLAFDGGSSGFRALPCADEIHPNTAATYLWYCSNNTIEGTQYQQAPDTTLPLMVDASSDIFSRPLDIQRHVAMFAAAQKNLGLSGVSLAIIHQSWLSNSNSSLPDALRYQAHAQAGSRLSTPPVFGIYLIGLIVQWLLKQGGLAVIEQRNIRKAKVIYDVLDRHEPFYQVNPRKCDRSCMNIVFRTMRDEMDRLFVEEAEHQGMSGLAGHRALGGLRASIYNAFPEEGCISLAQFLDDFAARHG